MCGQKDRVCSLTNDFSFLKFVIVVVDSTDRERISVTKEELYKMLAHEVSRPCVFFGLILIVGKIWMVHVKGEADSHVVCESSHSRLLAGDRPEWREASPVKPNVNSRVLPAAGGTLSELSWSC